MNGRFEKLIAAAVLAGAIGLTGCASSGGGNGNGTKDDGGGGGDTPENVAPELVSARTLDSTHLELIFSEPVDVGDTSAAAEMFALNASFRVSKLNYIDAAGTTCHNLTTDTSTWVGCAVAGAYSFSYYAITVQGLSVSSDQPDTLILATEAFLDGADGGTGLLRLTYTGGADGIADANGNALEDIALESSDVGNVLDSIGPPALVSARTISSDHIRLFFSEEMETSDASGTAASFYITANCVRALYQTSSFSEAFFYYANVNQSHYSVSGLNLVIDPDDPRVVDLILDNSILPIHNYRGYLRLYYSTNGLFTDSDGDPLGTINLSGTQRGNVSDEVTEEPANCFYGYSP